MSRPLVTDDTIDGLMFALACVKDQRSSSHARKDHSWDERYAKAIDTIERIRKAHEKASKKP